MNLKIGSTVGNWKIISDKYKKDGNRTYWCECECVCGNVKSVRYWHLNNNKTFGCGCTNTKGRFRSKLIGDMPLAYFNSFKKKRIRAGIFFSEDITPEFLWNLFIKQESKCAISGIQIFFNKNWSQQNNGSKKSNIKQTASLDRINSSEGYVIGNIQWVHKDINYMKGSLNEDEFLSYCKYVVEHRMEKNKGFGSNKI
jgi:hypothetical protein